MLKLLQYSYKDIDLFYSQEIKEDLYLNNSLSLEVLAWRTVDKFLGENSDYQNLVEAYAKKNNLEKIAILIAHGEKIKDTWYYFNEDAGSPIQSWINKMDGKYKVLILQSCNPGRNEITSKKSPILAPNEVYSDLMIKEGKVQIELFLPGLGYIDSYLIKEELKKLQT